MISESFANDASSPVASKSKMSVGFNLNSQLYINVISVGIRLRELDSGACSNVDISAMQFEYATCNNIAIAVKELEQGLLQDLPSKLPQLQNIASTGPPTGNET